MTDDDWDSISKNLYDTHHGYQTIAWIDTDYYIRRVMPLKGNEVAQNFNLRINLSAFASLLKAQREKKTGVSIPLSSTHDKPGIVIYAPIFDHLSTDKPLDGFIGSLLLFDVYISALLPSYLLMEHHLTLHIDGQEIYSDQPPLRIKYK